MSKLAMSGSGSFTYLTTNVIFHKTHRILAQLLLAISKFILEFKFEVVGWNPELFWWLLVVTKAYLDQKCSGVRPGHFEFELQDELQNCLGYILLLVGRIKKRKVIIFTARSRWFILSSWKILTEKSRRLLFENAIIYS